MTNPFPHFLAYYHDFLLLKTLMQRELGILSDHRIGGMMDTAHQCFDLRRCHLRYAPFALLFKFFVESRLAFLSLARLLLGSMAKIRSTTLCGMIILLRRFLPSLGAAIFTPASRMTLLISRLAC